MALTNPMLPVCRANTLTIQPVEQTWLIESVWIKSAVGIIGGPPKCCKSWLGLDMAISVASGTPCLNRFPIADKGPTLIFLAEDAIGSVRTRIDSICAHRKFDIDRLELYVITASALRLDLERDQKRLKHTLNDLRPRLLLLDPLIRLHRLDENSAADISNLLGYLREIQRTYDTAVVLVHHASKKHRAQPGQALRGSSDLHAFGDSNAYLARRNQKITLTLEHRSAKPPDPFELQLLSRSDGSATHLEIVSCVGENADTSLTDRILVLLQHAEKPLPGKIMREHLRVNNQRLIKTLDDLNKQSRIIRSSKGWISLEK
ncbi:MAG: AAA family ATPase [Desulfobacterales bacterium]|jgi:hypothetical protein|nr:AAA family ATPase [Desulfobacterales bacterium]MDP6736020.1 AAA family ATPase [Nitrospinaceae bacterium]